MFLKWTHTKPLRSNGENKQEEPGAIWELEHLPSCAGRINKENTGINYSIFFEKNAAIKLSETMANNHTGMINYEWKIVEDSTNKKNSCEDPGRGLLSNSDYPSDSHETNEDRLWREKKKQVNSERLPWNAYLIALRIDYKLALE